MTYSLFHIRPTLFRISGPKFDMLENQLFQQDNLIKTPTVCRSTQIRQGPCFHPLFLRHDWNPGQSEFLSSTETRVVAHLFRPFVGRVLVFDTLATLIPVPHKPGRFCQYWSIQYSRSRIPFGRCAGAVSFDLLRFDHSFSCGLVCLYSGW